MPLPVQGAASVEDVQLAVLCAPDLELRMIVVKKVNIKLTEPTKTLLARFGEAARPHMRNAMQATVGVGKAVAAEKAPKDRGFLQNSIYGLVEDQWPRTVGVLGSPVEHAAPMEYGTVPFWPPSGSIEEWVGRKFGLQGVERRSVAFLVRRAIAQRGLRARRFFAAGLKQAQAVAPALFERAMRNLEQRLSDK